MADDDRQAALNAIDLKGNIVLKEFGDTALLFRPQNNYEPFVVAYGYDKAAGEWSHGSYHTDLGHAFEEANPEIIEDACVRWQRGDIATALGNEEYPATDANVSWILNRSTMGDFHEEMTAKGNERLGEIVHEQERYLDKASCAGHGGLSARESLPGCNVGRLSLCVIQFVALSRPGGCKLPSLP